MSKHKGTYNAHTNKHPTSTRTRNEQTQTSTLAHRQSKQRRKQQRKNKRVGIHRVLQCFRHEDSHPTGCKTVYILRSDLRGLKEQVQSSDNFIAVKRTKSRLQSKEVHVNKIQCETVFHEKPKLSFECNRDLKNIMSIESFGKLTNQSTSAEVRKSRMLTRTCPTKPIHTPKRKQMIYSLSHKEDINIKTKTDREKCIIYGCAVLPSNKLVLTDYYNEKLKLVDTLTKEIVEEKHLDSKPFDVAVLSEDEIAVTIPAYEEILIIRTTGQLSTSRSIKVQGRCRGITYRHDRLYVVCAKNFVLILDMKGNVKDRISLEDETDFSSPYYIALNKNETLLYISDHLTYTVASVTVQGKTSAVYKDIKDPLGMVMLDDESLLVCCFDKSIYRLQADMKQSYEVSSGLKKPSSICWSPEKSEVYVGCENCDQLKVFSLQ